MKYRLAWVENGRCRVLFDNHRGKSDHLHIDGNELPYTFRSVEALWHDFRAWVVELGGAP